MAPRNLDVVIVGASIGGLICAITLSRYENITVYVLEREAELQPVRPALSIHRPSS